MGQFCLIRVYLLPLCSPEISPDFSRLDDISTVLPKRFGNSLRLLCPGQANLINGWQCVRVRADETAYQFSAGEMAKT